MDSEIKMHMERAENELVLAQITMKISDRFRELKELREGIEYKLKEEMTFYSAVISHAYYCIFYSAKAILLSRGIKIEAPEEHKKALEAFESELVRTGIIDVKLLEIYKEMIVRADTLLEIFSLEKSKRGKFTYKKLPQANRYPAKESI